MHKNHARMMILILCVGCFTAVSWADDAMREMGRKVAQDYEDALVRVEAVLNLRYSGGESSQEHEITNEFNGVVISPDGLIVISLWEFDFAALYQLTDSEDDHFSSRVKEIKIKQSKGDDIPAVVILRDNELGIAFLRPKQKPTEPMVYVNIQDSAVPQLLDPFFVVARMGKEGNRQISAMTGEIQSIVPKPRVFYIPSAEPVTAGFCAAAFTADGKFLGLVSQRLLKSEPSVGIILPASDVLESSMQAPAEAVEEAQAELPPASSSEDSSSTQPQAIPNETPGDEVTPLNDGMPSA